MARDGGIIRDARGRIRGGVLNPNGKPKLPMDVVRLCRDVTTEAIQRQIDIMRLDAGGDPAILSVQARVCENLLSRGWGTAPQTVVIQGDHTIRIDWGGPPRD